MKKLTRNKSLITGNSNLEHLYTFKQFPVFMGCTGKKYNTDLFADMAWYICKDSGIIQLKELLPLRILYQSQHVEGVGALWQEHYQEFAIFLRKYKVKNILEIGAAHGIIAKNYIKRHKETLWIVVEPHPTFSETKKIVIIKKWFDNKFRLNKKIDSIVHSHVLEHTYEPRNFINLIWRFLPQGGLHLFSIPNMREQLKRNYSNCLNFEHTAFLTEEIVDYLLQDEGFEILEKKYFRDHSIFYATRKTMKSKKPIPLPKLYQRNLKMFNNFINYHKRMVKRLNRRIVNAKFPVFLFGAHIFSQYLLNFGLYEKPIVSVLDNSTTKQGKRLYGTRFIVQSPKVLKGKDKTYVILKAGAYNDEIKKDILDNINKNVVFL